MKIVNLSENEWNIFAAPGSWTQVAWAMSTDSRLRTLMLNRSRYLILKQMTYSESVKGSLSSSLKKYKKKTKSWKFSFFEFPCNDDRTWRRTFSWPRYTSKTLDLSCLKMSALYLYSFLRNVADKIDFLIIVKWR